MEGLDVRMSGVVCRHGRVDRASALPRRVRVGRGGRRVAFPTGAYDIAVAAGLHPTDHLASHDAHSRASTGHDMAHLAGSSSWGMLAAHVLAAVLCGLWLAQGEGAAFKMVRACADRAFVPLRLVLAVLCPPPAPPSFRPAPRPGWRLRQLLLVHALTTRGPPGETAVV